MIRAFLKEHRVMLLVAFLLTLIIKAPVLAFPSVAGDAYRGINIYHFANMANDEDFYMSRGKEVLEGHALGNPLMREGKDTYPDYYFNVAERMLVGPFRLLGLTNAVSIATLYNIYNFVGVFVLTLLIYFFALELKANKLFAVAAAIFVVSGHTILDHRSMFGPLYNMYGRSLYPYIGSLLFFWYLLLCARMLKAPTLYRSLALGVLFGAMSYIYSYTWTFTLLFNGFLFLFSAVKRDWRAVKHIALISSVGIFISAYAVVRTVLFFSSPAGQQASYVYGAIYGHALAFRKLGPLLLLSFGLLAYRNRTDSNWPILYALLLAGWFSLNQQVITGVSMHPNHYLWYYVNPSLIIALTYAFFILVTNARARAAIVVAGIVISVVNTAVTQYRAFAATLPERLAEQDYAPILQKLAAESPGVVLAADDYPEFLVTVYTPHDIFWESTLGKFNDNPIGRHIDALLLYLYLNENARNDPRAYLVRILAAHSSSFYARIYRDIEGHYSGRRGLHDYEAWSASGDAAFARHRSAILLMLMRRYDALAKDPRGFEGLLDRYGIRWLLVDRNRQPEWDLSVFSGLTEIVSENNVTLFERSHSSTSASYSNDADRHHHSGAHELLAASG